MPIRPQNLELIEGIEKRLNEASIKFIDITFNQSTDLEKEYRGLKQTTIGLSLTVAGIVIPVILSREGISQAVKDHLFLAVVFFGLNIIWGIILFSWSLSGASNVMWENADARLKELDELKKELRRIKTLDDNDQAGIALSQLQHGVLASLKKKDNLRGRGGMTDIIFFALFLVGIGLTFISIMRILY